MRNRSVGVLDKPIKFAEIEVEGRSQTDRRTGSGGLSCRRGSAAGRAAGGVQIDAARDWSRLTRANI
jgi:hypothetical protein